MLNFMMKALVLILVGLIVGACGLDEPDYNGTYSATVTTVTPSMSGPQTVTRTGTFTVSNNVVSEPSGALQGTVRQSDGAYDGTTRVCDSCDRQALAGNFKTSGNFTLATCGGTGCDNAKVRQTIVAAKQ